MKHLLGYIKREISLKIKNLIFINRNGILTEKVNVIR